MPSVGVLVSATLSDKADPIWLKEGEMVELMNRSRGRHLRLTFGFGGEERVWLKFNDGWEADELAKIRTEQPSSYTGAML